MVSEAWSAAARAASADSLLSDMATPEGVICGISSYHLEEGVTIYQKKFSEGVERT